MSTNLPGEEHPDDLGDMTAEERLEMIRLLHGRSLMTATGSEYRGQHFCMACTTYIDDYTAYVVWPCKTARFAGAHSDESEQS